jgi:aminoglycoside phosphotransferase (APT) family kinase protein
MLSTAKNGWIELVESEELLTKLTEKLSGREQVDLVGRIKELAESTTNFTFRQDALVHNDIRADNCAWNAETGEVKVIDWNWLELGDRRTDLASMLVHVNQSGHNVLESNADRLDADALRWIAGYWLAAASKPIWPGGPESLRDFQLDSGIMALELAKAVQSN